MRMTAERGEIEGKVVAEKERENGWAEIDREGGHCSLLAPTQCPFDTGSIGCAARNRLYLKECAPQQEKRLPLM